MNVCLKVLLIFDCLSFLIKSRTKYARLSQDVSGVGWSLCHNRWTANYETVRGRGRLQKKPYWMSRPIEYIQSLGLKRAWTTKKECRAQAAQ